MSVNKNLFLNSMKSKTNLKDHTQNKKNLKIKSNCYRAN